MPAVLHKLRFLAACLIVTSGLAFACGDSDSDDLPLADRLTRQASPVTGAPTTAAISPSPAAPTVEPTPAPSPDAATVLQVRSLANLALAEADLPAGYTVRARQPAYKLDIVLAQIAIPELANYFEDSDLRGSWAALYTKPGPPDTSISSIVYLFATPESARALVDVASQIGAEDYLSATEAQLLPQPVVGESATFLRYTTATGPSLELTWSQGLLGGQVIMRIAGESEPIGATDLVLSLAQTQATRMATFLP
jgi:hypothetical protein